MPKYCGFHQKFWSRCAKANKWSHRRETRCAMQLFPLTVWANESQWIRNGNCCVPARFRPFYQKERQRETSKGERERDRKRKGGEKRDRRRFGEIFRFRSIFQRKCTGEWKVGRQGGNRRVRMFLEWIFSFFFSSSFYYTMGNWSSTELSLPNEIEIG